MTSACRVGQSKRVIRTRTGIVSSAVLAVLAANSAAVIPKGNARIDLEPVASGLTSPVSLTDAGDGSGRLFIVDQAGKIRVVKNGALLATPFLDLTAEIPVLNTTYDERGLLGLAFHPNYAVNGRFFVRYSKPRTGVSGEPCFGTARGCHEEILAEYTVSINPDVANPTGTILFRINKPQFNHNAGGITFGPDGLLYFSLGDGGGANDGLADVPPSHGPIGNGQNINVPLGKMLRINVDGAPPYAIPPGNPFVGVDGLDEIFAWGFRNPYRFSFDDGPGGDGRLIVADVGQNLMEEVDIVVNGGNYGWVIQEGTLCFDPFNPNVPPATCNDVGLIDPVAEYTHAEGGLAIVGGFVYRGVRFPCLGGLYVFGDFSADFGPTGQLYYMKETSPGVHDIFEFKLGLDDHLLGLFLKGLGQDEQGELYVLTSTALGPTGTTGEVYRLKQLLFGDADGDCDVDLVDYAAFAACLNGPNVSYDTDGLHTQTVLVGNAGSLQFTPANITIEVGDTVHWDWVSGFHSVQSGVMGVYDGNFRSGDPTLNTSTTFDVIFNDAFLAAKPMPGNVYPYHCAVHFDFGMIGSVTVQPDPCAVFDSDGDGDVDLKDYQMFQLSLAGPP